MADLVIHSARRASVDTQDRPGLSNRFSVDVEIAHHAGVARQLYLNNSTLSNCGVAHGRYRLSVNLVRSPGRTLTSR